MTKKPKVVYINGIEITTSLLFTGWKPGFEYTKNINLKNLNTKTVKLTYKIPVTKHFITILPKLISLSPGTSFVIPITFRPLDKKQYNDALEIEQLDFQKNIKIPLTAKLPEYKIDLNENINFGPTSIYDTISSTIKVTNTSELETYYEIDIKEPFIVSQLTGVINSKQSIDLTFSFQPKSALVYQATAILKFGEANNFNNFKQINLYGIGKFPHILIESNDQMQSEIQLNFDKVLVGQCVTRYFTLVNMTEVKTDYLIERDNEIPIFDRSFNCLQHMGTLLPFEKQKIAITYSPNYPSSDIIYNYFNVYSSGKICKNRVTCCATNKLPKVTLDKTILSFGILNVNQKIYRTFNIQNNSETPLDFQFDNDNDFSTFKMNITNGTLQPNEKKIIQVFFNPQNPTIYYKKVSCLIQNHDLIFIEFCGSCHSELIKPPEINRKNINLFNYLRINNLLKNPPEILLDMLENKKIFNEVSLDKVYLSDDYSSNANSIDNYIEDEIHSFRDKYSKNIDPCISIDSYYLDFGYTKPENSDVPCEKSITVSNQTKGKLVIYWNSSETQPFSISPIHCEIPPLKSYSFRVKYSPNHIDRYYCNKLEGYAIYKSLGDYTIADQKFILPSWCLQINCLGHTYHPSSETFLLPRYQLDCENIVFPISIRDKEIYRTLVVKNTSPNGPMIFDLQSLNNDAWSIKPHKGIIKKNEHQIFLLKFVPKSDKYMFEKCEIMLNYMSKHIIEIGLLGGGILPELSLENNGILYFPPTCKRNSSIQTYELINLTRSKIMYEWKIPYESKHLFSVNELQSSLEPYEKKKTLWKFSPEKIDKYNHKVTLIAWIDGHRQTIKPYYLRLLGSCTHGSLQVSDMYKDFGSVIIGSSISTEIVIMNNNDCRLDFELFVKQTTDEAAANKSLDNICVLELENTIGHVEARSKSTIRCRLRPIRLINYQFTIEYRIIYPNESNEFLKAESDRDTPKSMKEILCYMSANGVYPKLSITDLKAFGSASNLNKDYLWKLLSINELNSSMSCEPNPDELMYSIATRQEVNRRIVNEQKRPLIEMNFNASPINSEDTQVVLFFENTGLVTTEWVLLYPKDLLLELEYWAQNGEYTLDELEEMKVQDNKLFTIEPKKGKLEPGEIVRITITYKHLFTGQNKLPILMKIAKGREIMLNLIGTTVPKGEPYVYFPSNRFELEPIEIGLMEYPIQVYELYNAGDVPAHVEIDCSLVEELNQDNYASNILKCLNDKFIIIPPGTSFETKWKFSPIEAKTYHAEVIFKCNNSIYNIITFKCIGYDKRKLNNFSIEKKNQSIPEKQVFSLPNQLAYLSFDRLLLGDIPLFSRERKFLFVKNSSHEHKITFTWHVTNPDHIRFIRIQPSRGIIEPSQSKLCKVTFISIDKPAFYNINLICEIKNETEMETYKRDIELWKHEQRRQFEEFVIEENELQNRIKGLESSRDNDSTELDQAKTSEKKSTSQLGTHKFKTIPPIIKNQILEETNLERVRKNRNEKKKWIKPIPPSPFLLHLNVIARTQLYDEYLEFSNSIKNNSSKYVDSIMGFGFRQEKFLQNHNDNKQLSNNKKIVCNEEEKSALEFVFSDILRSLVTDKSFYSIVQSIKDEDVPYFFQYTQNDDPNTKNTKESNLKHKKKPKNQEESLQNIKTSPLFGSLVENIFENTIANILTEAFYKEFSLTNRPRLIALPPKVSQINLNGFSFVNSHNSLAKSKESNTTIASPVFSIKSTENMTIKE